MKEGGVIERLDAGGLQKAIRPFFPSEAIVRHKLSAPEWQRRTRSTCGLQGIQKLTRKSQTRSAPGGRRCCVARK